MCVLHSTQNLMVPAPTKFYIYKPATLGKFHDLSRNINNDNLFLRLNKSRDNREPAQVMRPLVRQSEGCRRKTVSGMDKNSTNPWKQKNVKPQKNVMTSSSRRGFEVPQVVNQQPMLNTKTISFRRHNVHCDLNCLSEK